MHDLDDTALERRLREVLKEHLGALPLDLTVDALDRRREARGGARRLGRGRGMTLLAAAALLLVGGALAGSGFLRQPAVVPPMPAPSFAVVTTASPDATPTHRPTPSASESPSPTPVSLTLSWTKVALDDKSPRVAWVGDRFVLADVESGAVRTSTDGVNWQALQPGDAAPGYVHLLGGSLATEGSLATWQDTVTNTAQDGGFGWYSPTGEHWTKMARRTTSSDLFGARLPTGAYGDVVGVSDGFIAGGGCARANDSCSGMWFSADGLTWRSLGQDSGSGLVPWMGGALVTNGSGHFHLWTSDGLSKLPVPADVHGIVGTGPLGFVAVAYDKQEAFVSRNGIDYGSSPIPAQMADANAGGTHYPPAVVVGDRTILVLERKNDEIAPITWSLWIGTFEP